MSKRQILCRTPMTALVPLAFMGLMACGSVVTAITSPRPLVVFSGARIQPDSAHLDDVDDWFQRAAEVIEQDPTFMVVVDDLPRPAYPWETLEFRGEDTVRVALAGVPDPALTYEIYGFLHLMKRMERIEPWFPEAATLEGYDLERFILDRTADTWLLLRSVYGAQPYAPLDEMVYAQDRGYLDEMILSARASEFPEVREAYIAEHPGRIEEYRTWFRETFDRDAPGTGEG